MTSTVPTTIKNLASDHDIVQCIPRPFNALEFVAASSKLAQIKAKEAGKTEPDRHDFLEAIPEYLRTLPSSTPDALAIVRTDAAEVLNLPGMAQDADTLAKARDKAGKAQAAVDEAEAIQGRRLAQIQTLEKRHEELQNSLTAWDLDYDAEIKAAEALVTEHWGKAQVVTPFETIAKAEVLRKLAPAKIASIRHELAEIEKGLKTLKS